MAARTLSTLTALRPLHALLLVTGLLFGPVRAQEIPPPAYQLAAQRVGIPSIVLYAVALQESGVERQGRIVPWPWSLNIAGASHRFATRASACASLRQAMRTTPHTRIDAGLGQINLGYQKRHYRGNRLAGGVIAWRRAVRYRSARGRRQSAASTTWG